MENKAQTRQNVYSDDERQYLLMMQDTITRMAGNSANCKTWTITIVAAMLAMSCSLDNLKHWILLSLIPIILFWYLDSYYLKLERGMRNRQRFFLNLISKKYPGDEIYKNALFDFKPYFLTKGISPEKKKEGDPYQELLASGIKDTDNMWKRESTWPFYGVLSIVVIVIFAILII